MADQGHWYTDKNGNHYLVKDGETPKEGWERSKRRKMIDGGKYKVDDGDGKGSREVSMEEYNKYEADDDFDETTDDDFGFDESEDESIYDRDDFEKRQSQRRRFLRENGLDSKYEVDEDGYLVDKASGMAILSFSQLDNDFDEVKDQISYYEDMEREIAGDKNENEGGSLENTDNRGEGANGVTAKKKPYIQYPGGAIKGPNGFLEEEEWAKVQKENPDAIRKATESEEEEYWAETEFRNEKTMNDVGKKQKERFDRFENDIGKAKTQSEFDRIKEEVDAAFENHEIDSDQKDALYDKIPADLDSLPLFGQRAMRAIEKRKNPASEAKRKVEEMLGRKFSEEEWKRIVELAKSIK